MNWQKKLLQIIQQVLDTHAHLQKVPNLCIFSSVRRETKGLRVREKGGGGEEEKRGKEKKSVRERSI